MPKFQTEYTKLNTSQIVILYSGTGIQGYQRKVNNTRVNQIVRNFNLDLVNPIKVSFRDGAYYCFDGSHTMHALKQRNGGNDLMVDCKVYYGMTYKDEARMFALQNGNSQVVTVDYKTKAFFEAGDSHAIALNNAVVAGGGKTAFSGEKGSKYKFSCTAALIRCYRAGGFELVTQVVKFIIQTWGDDQDGVKAEMVDGLSLFIRKLHTWDKPFNLDKISLGCRKTAPLEILRKAKADIGKKGALAVAYYILKAANKGNRSLKLQDILLEKK